MTDLEALMDWADKHVNVVQSPSTTSTNRWVIAWDRVHYTYGDTFLGALLAAYEAPQVPGSGPPSDP